MNTPLFHIPETLETERLILHAPRPGDSPEINAAVLESFDALHEWMPWAKECPSLEATELFSRESRAEFILRKTLNYRAYVKDGNVLAGCLSLFNIDWNIRKFEIGYWLRSSLVGKGYMTEAAGSLAAMAIGTLGAVRVEIRCDEKNRRSRRVAELLEFQLEGTLRNDSHTPAGELRNTCVYAVTANTRASPS